MKWKDIKFVNTSPNKRAHVFSRIAFPLSCALFFSHREFSYAPFAANIANPEMYVCFGYTLAVSFLFDRLFNTYTIKEKAEKPYSKN